MKNLKIISIVLGLALSTLLLSSCFNKENSQIGDKKPLEDKTKMEDKNMNYGDMATNFELMDLKGNRVNLADFKGKKVYVKYWASWCSICLAGLDDTNTLAKEAKDFQVITIVSPGFRGEKNTEDFKNWFSGLNKSMTVLLDEGGTISSKYGVRGYPTSVVIGSDGVLVKTLLGHKSNDEIKTIFKDVK